MEFNPVVFSKLIRKFQYKIEEKRGGKQEKVQK